MFDFSDKVQFIILVCSVVSLLVGMIVLATATDDSGVTNDDSITAGTIFAVVGFVGTALLGIRIGAKVFGDAPAKPASA